MKALAPRPGALALLALSLAMLLGGCAWSNRANRPVWNAFEANLVPEETTAFYASLPLTLPAGLVCILVDSFVVHPAQVADDAWEDAGDVWHGIDWDKRYYTQLVVLPLRVAGTPVVFVVMFLGRSLFDIPPHGSKETAKPGEAEPPASDADAALERALLERLTAIAQATPGAARVSLEDVDPPARWTAALERGYAEALEHGRALDRLNLYLFAQQHELPPWRAERTRALRDPDPVVRYLVLEDWPGRFEVPADVQAALRADPDEAVRQLALQRWP